MYHDLFYNDRIGDYVFYPDVTRGLHHDRNFSCYYDIYLARFVNDSMLFFTGDYASTSVVTYDDVIPKMFDFMYKHTLWYALLTKSTNLLAKYPYYFAKPITKTFSPILYDTDGKCFGFDLVLDSKTKQTRPDLAEYFPHKLINKLVDGETTVSAKEDSSMDFDIVDIDSVINSTPQKSRVHYTNEAGEPTYIAKAKNNTVNEITVVDSTTAVSENDGEDAVYDMVSNFMSGDSVTYDPDTLINTLYHYTLWSYHMIPVVIYILKAVYSSYYKSNL
jgi:hypothetical protein